MKKITDNVDEQKEKMSCLNLNMYCYFQNTSHGKKNSQINFS